MLGVIDDVNRRTPMAWTEDGQAIYLLGETKDEFAGSEWAHLIHDHLGGYPPSLDLSKEKTLAEILIAGSLDGMIIAAHDVSDGGLAQSITEMATNSNHGARFWVPEELDPFVFLFSESATRAVVVVSRSEEGRFVDLCNFRKFMAMKIGIVDSKANPLPEDAEHLLEIHNVYGNSISFSIEQINSIMNQTFIDLFEN